MGDTSKEHLQPSLMFAGKVGAFLVLAPSSTHPEAILGHKHQGQYLQHLIFFKTYEWVQ
jgi:hypothetical protein